MLVLQAILVAVLSMVGAVVIYAATRGIKTAFRTTQEGIQAEIKKLKDKLQRIGAIGAIPEPPPDNSRILTIEDAIQRGPSQDGATSPEDSGSPLPADIVVALTNPSSRPSAIRAIRVLNQIRGSIGEIDIVSMFPEEILSRMLQEEIERSLGDWTEQVPNLDPLAEERSLEALVEEAPVSKSQKNPPPTEPKPEPPTVWERLIKGVLKYS